MHTTSQPKTKKRHVKKGDLVKVIAGNEKNKTGKIRSIDTKKQRAIVETLNLRTHHIKPTQQSKGKRQKKENPLHISNLMLIDPSTGKPTRTGRKTNERNKQQRYAKTTNRFIN